ncbi:PREDICTED: putative regulator of nonsense transcripts 1 [Diuraphis noxia]|nr:PREDICTED: putative regulator of nonsense transcripts 1 [Diuraphis noxia]
MIVSLVEILLNSECQSLTIAVLTPYHKQREQINMLLRKKKISLNVNTIDSFQGGECDVLLISTVRTNGVGFMDDICRLNVALTRARQSLIICGNFMSLRGEQVWSDLLEDARKRKLIKKVSKKVITNSRVLLAMIKI